MANVPYSEGVSDVDPAAGTPDDRQHVQATAEQFGSEIGRGAQQGAQSLRRAGQFFSEVAADDASNDFQSNVTKMVRGDPTKQVQGPDGQMTADTGYMGLKGRAALDARPGLEKNIDDLMQQTRGALATPEQQLQFDNFSRRYKSLVMSQVGEHADQQSFAWYNQVNRASADLAVNHIAANADNQQEVWNGTADLINARVKQAQLAGAQPGDPVFTEAVSGARKDAIKAQVNAVGTTDPAKALSILEKNKDYAGDEYKPLQASLRSRADQQQGIQAAQGAIDQAFGSRAGVPVPGAQPAPRQISINEAIQHQEWSGAPAAAPTSVTGAVGPGQIEPATFAQYAQPGEDINNPADNLRVSNRIIDDLKTKYADDPSRVAVGYFSGPGNVAPAGSPTPWVRDVADPSGKKVSSYVQDVTNRMATATPHMAMRADAITMAMKATEGNPAAQRTALNYIHEQYQAAETASLADQKAKKDANDNSAKSFVTRLQKGDIDGLTADIAKDPNLDWRTQLELGDKVQTHLKQELTGDAKTYGPGIYNVIKMVNLPPGNPSRINSPAQALSMFQQDGPLTLAGVDKVISLLKDPNETKQIEAALTYAKPTISFEQAIGNYKIPDPEGEKNFNLGFVPAFFKAYEDGKAKGHSTYEMLSKDSKTNIIAPLVAQYKGVRSDADMVAAKISAVPVDQTEPGHLAVGPPDLTKFDTKTPDGMKAARDAVVSAYWADPSKYSQEQALTDLEKLGVPRKAKAAASAAESQAPLSDQP